MRAFARIIGVQDSGPVLGVSFDVTYGSEVRANQAIEVPDDSSVREILNAVTEFVISERPSGTEVAAHDVILTSLERG